MRTAGCGGRVVFQSLCLRGSLPDVLKFTALMASFMFANVLCGKSSAAAQRAHREAVRPDHYSIEIQSTRSDDKPRMVNTWAHVIFEDEHYRALMPANIVRGPGVVVDFRWAPGSNVAGEAERVELEWKEQRASAWQSRLLGEGFRDPGNGHLILSPAQLNFGSIADEFFDLRFLVRDSSGRVNQDGGTGSNLRVQVAAQQPTALVRFSEGWNISQSGYLIAGKSFEIEYALERIEQQLVQGTGSDSAPWCLLAKVQFDDGPVHSYPLLAAHLEHPEKVIGLLPTVQIPEQARRMTIWFFAFHNTQSYFDSNFGQNYNFVILPR
jgi:hypothetical protein